LDQEIQSSARRNALIVVLFAALITALMWFNSTYLAGKLSPDQTPGAAQENIVPNGSLTRQALDMIAAASGDPAALSTARAILAEALENDSTNPVALFAMGWALQTGGTDSQAKVYYEQSLERLYEFSKLAHYNLSLILEQQGELEDALYHLRSASTLDPDYQIALLAESRLLLSLGRLEESIDALERAADVSEPDPNVLIQLGKVYWATEQKELAEQVWIRAIEINPNLKDEINGLRTSS
jgi:tetratricopeptide (TPR) repeat protein